MSGAELVNQLRRSGTGDDKIEACRAVLRRDPAATTETIVSTIVSQFGDNITALKARRFAGGESYLPEPDPLEGPRIEDVLLGLAAT